MGNNALVKVIGKGTTRIKMRNDIMRMFTNVRHVPDLKNNHISLSTPESLGYKYAAEDGVLKINRGASVFTKARKFETLYLL